LICITVNSGYLVLGSLSMTWHNVQEYSYSPVYKTHFQTLQTAVMGSRGTDFRRLQSLK